MPSININEITEVIKEAVSSATEDSPVVLVFCVNKDAESQWSLSGDSHFSVFMDWLFAQPNIDTSKINRSVLYDSYLQWCRDAGLLARSKRRLYSFLRSNGVSEQKSVGIWYFCF